ncbi:MAG: hypothetical protein ACFCGT_23505 [Sandaracinaceae bacterium]
MSRWLRAIRAAAVGRVLLVAALASPGALLAQSPAVDGVDGEVLVILARTEEGPVAPALADLSALREPPLDRYRSLELLSSPRIRLRPGQPEEVDLPNGRKVRLVLEEVTADGRFRVTVSINRPGRRDYLPEARIEASPGDPFFVGGQAHQGGTLVIGVRLGTR